MNEAFRYIWETFKNGSVFAPEWWEKVPPHYQDGIFMASMLLQREKWNTFDWLSRLDKVSEKNRETVFYLLVEERRQQDGSLPYWLYLACYEAEQRGWEIPGSWIIDLQAALT